MNETTMLTIEEAGNGFPANLDFVSDGETIWQIIDSSDIITSDRRGDSNHIVARCDYVEENDLLRWNPDLCPEDIEEEGLFRITEAE